MTAADWIFAGIAVACVVGIVVALVIFVVTWYGQTTYAATRRWRAINRAQPKVCNCGAPGTVRRTAAEYGYAFVGSESPAWWYCAEHADVSPTATWQDGRPLS
jgi:hypothetical protein